MIVLFKSIPGFEQITPRVRSAAEEIDLTVMNQSTDPLWSKESPFFLVECKNWSRTTERKELDAFASKLLRRGERCRLGFFVAIGGFSQGFKDLAGGYAARGFVIVLVDQRELEALVLAGDGGRRNDVLKRIYQRAALQGETGGPSCPS
jgi:restriction endonuclease Mrr